MSKRGDNHTLRRKIRMLDLLPDGAYRKIAAADLHDRLLAEGFVIDRRGVERDLDHLSNMFPLQRSRGKPAGWYWSNHRKPPPLLGMDDETALIYSMLERFLTPLLPPSLLNNLIPQFTDARHKLTSGARTSLKTWNQRIAVAPETQPLLWPKVSPQTLHIINRALLDSLQCEFTYRSMTADGGDKSKRHRVAPYGLVMRGKVLYLVAGYDNSKPYTFALHRMQSPVLLDIKARIPKDFDVQAYAVDQHGLEIGRGMYIKLELKVNAWWGHYFGECPLSSDQVVRELPDEDEVLVSATVTDTDQLRWWLLSLGRALEVRKPKALREWMGKETEAMAQRYTC